MAWHVLIHLDGRADGMANYIGVKPKLKFPEF